VIARRIRPCPLSRVRRAARGRTPLARRGPIELLVATLCAVTVAGCAAAAPTAHPGAATTAPRAAASAPPARPRATVDSLPSADALAVLAGIPEPLGPGESVPPPAIAGAGIAATRAPADSLGAALADTAGAAPDTIPVPVETAPLGDAPGTLARPAVPDTTPPPPPAAPPPEAAPAKPAGPDTCWRIQFAAPDKSDEAEMRRSAAQSLLMIPVVIELKSGLFKVRTSDCLSEEAADRLRERARSSGFTDAFRFQEIRR
jgi:hypothetical protein